MRLIFRTLSCILLSLPLCIAQTPTVEYFSDISDVEELYVRSTHLWLKTRGGILQLDTTGRLIRQFGPLDGFSLGADLHQDSSGYLYLHDDKRDDLFIWDDARSDWRLLMHFDYNSKDYKHLKVTQKQLWLVGKEQMARCEKGELTVYPYHLAADELIDAFQQDSKGHIWIETYKQLYCQQPDTLLEIPLPWDYARLYWYRDVLYAVRSEEEQEDRYEVRFWNGGVWKNSHAHVPTEFYTYGLEWATLGDRDWWLNAQGDYLCSYRYRDELAQKVRLPYTEAGDYVDREYFTDPAVDARGRVWLGGRGRLLRWDDGDWASYALPDKPFAPNAANQIFGATFRDAEQRVWFGGVEGIYCLEKGQWRRIPDEWFDRSAYQYAVIAPTKFLQAADGSIWITPQEGAFRRNAQGRWEAFLMDKGQLFMYQNAQKQVCFLAEDGASYSCKAGKKIEIKAEKRLEQGGWKLRHAWSSSKGDLWLPAACKVYQYNSRAGWKEHPFELPRDRCDEYLTFAEDKKGQVYAFRAGLSTELRCIQQPDSLSIRIPFPDTEIYDLCSDAQGNWWFLTDKGVWEYKAGQWRSHKDLRWNQSIVRESLYIDSRQGLWQIRQGDNQGKLCRWDMEQRHLQTILSFPFDSVELVAVHEDPQGFVWLFTSEGTFRVKL